MEMTTAHDIFCDVLYQNDIVSRTLCVCVWVGVCALVCVCVRVWFSLRSILNENNRNFGIPMKPKYYERTVLWRLSGVYKNKLELQTIVEMRLYK